ncbi:hypothetical protein EI94DRAFT_1698697 [Lactarius quietus]|nr:hypothetical protein EI94DRAFT_1698697 [Lactarius quietus]
MFQRVLRAFLVLVLCWWAGAWSIIPSVMLKSPNMKSGCRRLPLPGLVTPAVALGLSGCWEMMTSSLFLKQATTSYSQGRSRWVSWSARIAFLFSFMVWFMADHLSIPDILHAGAEKLFMFNVAMVILALSLRDLLAFLGKGGSQGVGWPEVLACAKLAILAAIPSTLVLLFLIFAWTIPASNFREKAECFWVFNAVAYATIEQANHNLTSSSHQSEVDPVGQVVWLGNGPIGIDVEAGCEGTSFFDVEAGRLQTGFQGRSGEALDCEKEALLGGGEVVCQEAGWVAVGLGSLGGWGRGRYSVSLGLGDFCYGVEDPVLDEVMEFCFVASVTKGDDEELSSHKVFSLTYEVQVYVLKGGGGVGIMDFQHVGISIIVQRVACDAMAVGIEGLWGFFNDQCVWVIGGCTGMGVILVTLGWGVYIAWRRAVGMCGVGGEWQGVIVVKEGWHWDGGQGRAWLRGGYPEEFMLSVKASTGTMAVSIAGCLGVKGDGGSILMHFFLFFLGSSVLLWWTWVWQRVLRALWLGCVCWWERVQFMVMLTSWDFKRVRGKQWWWVGTQLFVWDKILVYKVVSMCGRLDLCARERDWLKGVGGEESHSIPGLAHH